MVSNGGKHLLGSTTLCYLSREQGEQGLRLVEEEYKAIEIKSALKLFKNTDPTMELVRMFEEQSGVISNFGPLLCLVHQKQRTGEKEHQRQPAFLCLFIRFSLI